MSPTLTYVEYDDDNCLSRVKFAGFLPMIYQILSDEAQI